jgi:hypothetical protein
MDLASKCDPVDCPSGGPTAIRVSLPKQLALEIQAEQEAEMQIAPAIMDVIAKCHAAH